MLGNCVLVPATYYRMKEKYGNDTCKHCINHRYGCPTKSKITVGLESFIPVEDNESELPKCGIWCRTCKQNSGKIKHEVIWNGKNSYVIKCPICGSEFLLYKAKVRSEYTGFTNMKGEFVKPDLYGKTNPFKYPIEDKPDELIASVRVDNASTIMMDALKKAGIK